MSNAIKAVVFDLDGTLIDSVPDLHGAAVRLLKERGSATISLERAQSFVGDGARVFVQKTLAETEGAPDDGVLDAATERFIALYEAHTTEHTVPYDGVMDALEQLKARGLALGICTNKPERATHKVLGLLGLSGYFDAIVGGDTLPVRKPDPAHASEVLTRLGIPAENACMVGDNEHDASAAAGAGMPFILMRYGYARRPHDEIPAAHRLDRFAELPDAITSLA